MRRKEDKEVKEDKVVKEEGGRKERDNTQHSTQHTKPTQHDKHTTWRQRTNLMLWFCENEHTHTHTHSHITHNAFFFGPAVHVDTFATFSAAVASEAETSPPT